MRYVRTRAIPLGGRPRGEADRIVVLLTEDLGKVRAVAKGVRRTTSRYGGAFEAGNLIDIRLYRRPGREIFTATEVEILDARPGLRASYARLAAAGRLAERLDRLLAAEDPAPDVFALADFTLRRLAEGGDPATVLGVFDVRLAAHLGWRLDAGAGRLGAGARRFVEAAATDPLEKTARYRLTPATALEVERAVERHFALHAEAVGRFRPAGGRGRRPGRAPSSSPRP